MLIQRKIFQSLLVFLAIGMLSACGPIYRPHHSYSPPKSSHGMMCVSNCSSARTNCDQLNRMRKENCEQQAELAYQFCKKGGTENCLRKSCYDIEQEDCASRYNECYQNCGGTVTTQQVCTAFCN